MDIKWTDIVAAIGTILIPIVIFYASETAQDQRNRIATESRTLSKMDELDKKINYTIDIKKKLDAKYHVTSAPGYYSSKYVMAHEDVEEQVIALLDEYESICIGGNSGLYSNKVIKDTRGDWLKQTFQNYKDFISDWRKQGGAHINAWTGCEQWAKAN